MTTFIDHVRCGECDAGITLEVGCVTVQRYRRQPWLRHFWVRCDSCAADKLYWPTPRQMRLAERLECLSSLGEVAPFVVAESFNRSNRMPLTDGWAPLVLLNQDLGFLRSMLAATYGRAATSGPAPSKAPAHSYLPAYWAN